MTRQDIMDEYALEQGYENWDNLVFEQNDIEDIMGKYEKVITLIQIEQQKVIMKHVDEDYLNSNFGKDSIINNKNIIK